MTPASLRFLGRRVYLAAVVVVASALLHGVSQQRISHVQKLTGVSIRTLKRWRDFWLREFVATPCWRAARGSFMPSVDETQLPTAILAALGSLTSEEGAQQVLIRFLTLILPLSSKTMGRAGPQTVRRSQEG